MATLAQKPANFLKERLQAGARVLLVNPPVHERRYHWLRWNQPSELLRLSTWLKAAEPRVEVRLFDFMFPDSSGGVQKHKVQESWRDGGAQLWHFGSPFRDFEDAITRWVAEKWVPDIIVITSLTSYWHSSITTLVAKLCTRLGRIHRERVTLCLYGNYPRFEPEHASRQLVDVAFTETVNTQGCTPDFGLYLEAHKRAPLFYGLDVYDSHVSQQIDACVDNEARANRLRGLDTGKPPSVTLAFLNDNVGRSGNRWRDVAAAAARFPGQIIVEGIAGIEPSHLTKSLLGDLKNANVRSLYVEHARRPGGDVDVEAYAPLIDVLTEERRNKQAGRSATAWLDKAAVTGFVVMGMRDDDMDCLVRSTLALNQFFEGVILKPFGFSPTNNPASDEERRWWWKGDPSAGSPQWFPFAGRGGLQRTAYEDLIRWQNLLNKRVKGATFDFLGDGNVARLVRETLVMESWKRHREVSR